MKYSLLVFLAFAAFQACAALTPQSKSPAQGWYCVGGDIPYAPVGAYVCFDTQQQAQEEVNRLQAEGHPVRLEVRP